MRAPEPRKRVSKRLLVAALGVATVSYVGATGCAADTSGEENELSENSEPYDDETEALGEAQQGLTGVQVFQTSINKVVFKPKLPGSGNLMPPPGGPVIIDDIVVGPIPLPPSGNLMAPPIQEHIAIEQVAGVAR